MQGHKENTLESLFDKVAGVTQKKHLPTAASAGVSQTTVERRS